MLRLVYSFTVLTVDNEHETLGASVVMSPERTDLVLSSDVPDGERNVLVLYSLNVEACGMKGRVRSVSARGRARV